jgi:hypothetical protein
MQFTSTGVRTAPIVATVTSLLLLLSLSNPARADILGFGDFSGFSINKNDSAAAPTISISPSTIALTGSGVNEARSIFYNTPQSTTHFAASFTYQETGGSDIVGFAFVLQNDPRGASAVGGDDNGLGYGFGSFITPSDAVEFPLYTPFLPGQLRRQPHQRLAALLPAERPRVRSNERLWHLP